MAVRQAKSESPRAETKLNKIVKSKNKKDNKVLLVAQEIKFAKTLAGNDKKARDKVLRNLKKWLTYRSASTYEFSERDFIRLWKGLFYCVWMSDKPLVQEELCESISGLFECFGDKVATSALFYKCFLITMAADWFGIDQHRIDKFLMLVRRMTRGLLRCIKQQGWSAEALTCVQDSLTSKGGIFAEDQPRLGLGLQMHLADCWMEEVAKISQGELSAEAVVSLTKPFAMYVCYGEDTRLAGSITRHIFTHLMKQTDVGIEYYEKLNAWKEAGFPGGSIDAMEKMEEESDEEDNKGEQEDSGDETKKPKRKLELDPRAGNVDTELPQLPVDANLMASMIKELITDPRTTSRNRNKLRSLILNFETLATGTYPYKMKNVVLANDPMFRLPKTAKLAAQLLDFEDQCKELNEDEEMRGMNKRQRRKYLMKQKKLLESGELDDDDDDAEALVKKQPPTKKPKKDSTKVESGVWEVEDVKENEDIRPESSKNVSPIKYITETDSAKKQDKGNLKKNKDNLLKGVKNGKVDKKNSKRKKDVQNIKKNVKIDSELNTDSVLLNGSALKKETVSKGKVGKDVLQLKKEGIIDSHSKSKSPKKTVVESTSSDIENKDDAASNSVQNDSASKEKQSDTPKVIKKKNLLVEDLSVRDKNTPKKKKVLDESKKGATTPKLNKSEQTKGVKSKADLLTPAKRDSAKQTPEKSLNEDSTRTPQNGKAGENSFLRKCDLTPVGTTRKSYTNGKLGNVETSTLNSVKKQRSNKIDGNKSKTDDSIIASTPKPNMSPKRKTLNSSDSKISDVTNKSKQIVSTPKKNDESNINKSKQKTTPAKKGENQSKKEETPSGKKNSFVTPEKKNSFVTPEKKSSKNVEKDKNDVENSGETEIVVPLKRNQRKKERLNSSDSNVLKSQKNRLNILKSNLSLNSPSRKKVMIALKKNTSHAVIDYFKSVKQSPEIPFDGEKRPLKTSLKPNTMPSPINPFYKKKLKLNF